MAWLGIITILYQCHYIEYKNQYWWVSVFLELLFYSMLQEQVLNITLFLQSVHPKVFHSLHIGHLLFPHGCWEYTL